MTRAARSASHLVVLSGVLAAMSGAPSDAAPRGALPDWPGQWETIGITPIASGVIAETLEDSLARWDKPPFTPAWQKQFDEQAKVLEMTSLPARPACTPFGFPMMMLEAPSLFEVLITPRETALIFSEREVRHIYTDGRPHRPPEESWPTVWGDSIGHWEKDTLVIETTGMLAPGGGSRPPAAFVWDRSRIRLTAIFSDRIHTVERLRLLSNGELEDQLTFVDPVALTRPWTVVRHYRRVPAPDRMIQDDCTGDERNPIVNGETTLIVR